MSTGEKIAVGLGAWVAASAIVGWWWSRWRRPQKRALGRRLLADDGFRDSIIPDGPDRGRWVSEVRADEHDARDDAPRPG